MNSSSTLKNFLLLLNRNAFDLNLKATQLSDDKEFYIEMALRWNFTSCRQRWCFKKKKERDAHYRAFTAVELLQMLEVAWLTAAVTSLSSLILELFWTQEVTGWRHYSEDLKNEWEPLLSGSSPAEWQDVGIISHIKAWVSGELTLIFRVEKCPSITSYTVGANSRVGEKKIAVIKCNYKLLRAPTAHSVAFRRTCVLYILHWGEIRVSSC